MVRCIGKVTSCYFICSRFHPSGEIMVKRENDPWIIAKRSDMRELFLAVNQRNANLKEISGKNSIKLNVNNKNRRCFL